MFNAFSHLLFSFVSVIVSWAQLAQGREFWKTLEIITPGLETREGLSLPELAFRDFNQHMTIDQRSAYHRGSSDTAEQAVPETGEISFFKA